MMKWVLIAIVAIIGLLIFKLGIFSMFTASLLTVVSYLCLAGIAVALYLMVTRRAVRSRQLDSANDEMHLREGREREEEERRRVA
jgi:hypothetical protein